MATHKVPQDVEAEDKVVGFLSMRQLIFVMIGFAFGYLTFFFFTKVHPITAIIWVPFTLFFFVLGLWQRADQPVEVYLMSAIHFYLAPRKKIWDQEGYEERVSITAPPKIEHQYTKNFTGAEAVGRLQNLSRLMDSRGWASKGSDWQNAGLATAAQSTDRIVNIGAIAAQSGVDIQQYTQPRDIQEDPLLTQRVQEGIDETEASARDRAIAVLRRAQAATDNKPLENKNGSPHTLQPRTATIHQKVVAPTTHTAEIKPAAPAKKPDEPTATPEKHDMKPKTTTPMPKPAAPPKPSTSVFREQTLDDGSTEIKLH